MDSGIFIINSCKFKIIPSNRLKPGIQMKIIIKAELRYYYINIFWNIGKNIG